MAEHEALREWRLHVGETERRILEAAVEAGQRTGARPHLVGGPVRDLVLGTLFADVDLLIEADGSAFAAELSSRLNGELHRFPAFLTWRIDLPNAAPVDITTARTETYDQPGTLPRVTTASVSEDLFRRDFAANAIALDLTQSELIDPTEGLRDIRTRVMRALHPRSFFDDPTRMLRGIRLATRLGFHLETRTAEWMREAIAQDALATISRERIWREIFLCLREPLPAEALIAMNTQGLLAGFLTPTAVDPELLRRIEAQLSREPGADREVIYAGSLLASASVPEACLDGVSLSQARRKKSINLVRDAIRLAGRIEEAKLPLEQLRLCNRASVEVKVVASALSDPAAQVIRRFRDYLELELGIRGNELDLPSGPHLARALEATREAVYLGMIPKEEAPAFARSIGLQYLKGEID